ncbi:MAG: opioid growth factor receptor-related protein [Vicinamibacterales bacterium]
MSDSPLLTFYRGTGTDHAGRRLSDVLAWDDDALESVHDYIQWVFPGTEPSRANAQAPLLSSDDIGAFHEDAALRATLRRAFDRFLDFYGFRLITTDGESRVEPGPNWTARSQQWLQRNNHNHLRLTRIVRCLHALGLQPEAKALQRALLDVAERTHVGQVSRSTVRFWRAAIDGASDGGLVR